MNYNPDCFGRLNEKQFLFPLPHPQTKEQTSEQLQQHSSSDNPAISKSTIVYRRASQSCITGRHDEVVPSIPHHSSNSDTTTDLPILGISVMGALETRQ